MSEKIETDAIEEAVEAYIDTLQRRIHNHQGVIGECAACRNAERAIAATRAQLARLKAAAQERDEVVEECAKVCDRQAAEYVAIYEDTADEGYLKWAQEHIETADMIRALKSGVHRDESEEAGRG